MGGMKRVDDELSEEKKGGCVNTITAGFGHVNREPRVIYGTVSNVVHIHKKAIVNSLH